MNPLKKPLAGFMRSPENLSRHKRSVMATYFGTIFRWHAPYFGGCLLIIAFHLMAMSTPLMERFEHACLDLFFRQRPPIVMHPAIVHIDIDENSLRALGTWPWSRYQHATLIRILREWGAKAIVFDVPFSGSSSTFDDEALNRAIREAGNVYLPRALGASDPMEGWLHAMPEFERFAKGVGHVNIFPDRDGVVRRVAPFVSFHGETYPCLGIKVAFDYLGKDFRQGQLAIPKDSEGRIFVNWTGKWKDTFKHYSFLDIVSSHAAIREGWEPFVSPHKIRDKICVVGLTAPGLTDVRVSPIEKVSPVVSVQSNVMNSVLQGQYVQPVASRWSRVVLWAIGILLSFVFFFSRPVFSFLAGAAAGSLWVYFAFRLFAERGIWIHVIDPLFLIVSLFAFSTVFSITIGKRERERLFTLATKDGLTGLYMIRHFRTLLSREVVEAQKKHHLLSILLLEVDLFKKIHEEHGDIVGDAVLRFVAETLRSLVQARDESEGENAVGRYGGEEFIVMFRRCHLTDAAFDHAEKIRKRFEENPFIYEGVEIPLTVSIGVATLWPRETVPDMMVLRADEALYCAKTEGRNRVCVEKEYRESAFGAENELRSPDAV